MKSLMSLAAAVMFAAVPTDGIAGVEHSVTGVGGYDLVSYRTGEKPLPGNGNHVSEVDGVTYLFVNAENKRAFDEDPQKYLPAYGGFCAYGVAVNKKFIGDPNVWEIVHGRLYLNLDNKIKGIWIEDVPGNIKKADKNWTKIRPQHYSAL